MLKGGSRKSVAHSSMSSGELLQNLEHSYDYSKSNDNSGNSEDTNQNQTKSTTAQQIKQSTPIHEFVIKDAKNCHQCCHHHKLILTQSISLHNQEKMKYLEHRSHVLWGTQI